MTNARIALAWWPPEPHEQIGDERAHELVAAIILSIGPVYDEAEEDLRQRIAPSTEVVRSGISVNCFARMHLDLELEPICIGTVHEAHSGDARQNAIHLHRDGSLRWRRDR